MSEPNTNEKRRLLWIDPPPGTGLPDPWAQLSEEAPPKGDKAESEDANENTNENDREADQ